MLYEVITDIGPLRGVAWRKQNEGLGIAMVRNGVDPARVEQARRELATAFRYP